MERDFYNSVLSKVDDVAANLSLLVHFDNVSKTAPDGNHLRVSILPTSPENIDTCGNARYRWILQIAVYVRDGVGMIPTMEIIDDLRQEFPVNSKVGIYQQINVGEVIPPINLDAFVAHPVQFIFEGMK